MAKSKFERLPGFRDFAPEELAGVLHIFDSWRTVSTRYGFSEYGGPPLELLELYVEKSGEEIVQQLYNFQDKGQRKIALRPEMTPSLARILAGRHRAMAKPIRWFSLPQLFRYERQQRGRLREHFQWNVDIVGEQGVGADVEVLAVALDGLRELGLRENHIVARVSDRKLMTEILLVLGVKPGNVSTVFTIIDKMERTKVNRSMDRLCAEAELDTEVAEKVLEICYEDQIEVLRQKFEGSISITERLDVLQIYIESLEAKGLGAYVQFDLKIVRGLAYYTGIVFEIFDRAGDLRAICGGGRYDRLLELVGGDPLPAVGFGMGDVVLGELLRIRKLFKPESAKVDLFLVIVGEEQRTLALSIAHNQRENGLTVLYGLHPETVGKQLEVASKVGACQVLMLAPDELERGLVVLKDMKTGEQREMRLEEFIT
jgi:histidyl-tRNA synthetase